MFWVFFLECRQSTLFQILLFFVVVIIQYHNDETGLDALLYPKDVHEAVYSRHVVDPNHYKVKAKKMVV